MRRPGSWSAPGRHRVDTGRYDVDANGADAGWLVKQLGGAREWAEACGSVPVAAFTITKLSWLHRMEPDAFARLARVLLPHDWLTWRLSGRFVTDRGDASGTGYWSPAEGRWRRGGRRQSCLCFQSGADVDRFAARRG